MPDKILRLAELPTTDRPRLGRHIRWDVRSLGFMVENQWHEMAKPLRSVEWDRRAEITDQKSTGSCTAQAAAGILGTEPFWTSVGSDTLLPDAKFLEEWALIFYGDETKLDNLDGIYPPTDTGSNGLAACKVLKNRGLVASYRWARTMYGLARLLQDGPVMMGSAWLEAFFEPDRHGFIDSGDWAGSNLAGGHEFEVLGIELVDPIENSVLTACNSWSTGWGDHGRFRLRLSTYQTLRSYADLKQVVV